MPIADPDGDGVHSVTVDLPAGNFEYKYAVDGWAGQENLIDDMQNGASCAPITDYFSYANRLIDVNGSSVISNDLIVNGGFDNGSQGWALSNGWAVIDCAADLWYNGTAYTLLIQFGVLSSGNTYRLTFDANVASGSLDVYSNNVYTPENVHVTIDSTGTYSVDFVANGNDIRLSLIHI